MDEELCLRCGLCCRIKEPSGEFVRLTDTDCEFLMKHEDGKTSCQIYHERFFKEVNGHNVCVPIQEALRYGDLPPTCPYAKATPGYETKVLDWMG